MSWRLVLVVLVLAGCGMSRPPLKDLALPVGYQDAGVESGEPAAFRRQYRRDVGATEVELHRVDTPDGGPPLVVVSFEWARAMDDRVVALASRLHRDVPIGGGTVTRVAGRPAYVHESDDTFQSVVLAVDGRRGVLVYGGPVADERNVAGSVLKGWAGEKPTRTVAAARNEARRP
jgi:hypothetical protein